MNQESVFVQLDLGSAKPVSVPMETIQVVLSSENLLGQFGKSFVKEGWRVNPLRMEQISLTSDEMEAYCKYLLAKRIECVNGDCKDYRRLKCFYIPSWIQYNLSMIGLVIIRDKGIKLEPIMEDEDIICYDDALRISEKIGMLSDDLQVVQDGMPRDIHGDKDVMSTALIAGYARSIEKVEHISSTYVSAFLGMKLKEEMAFKTLYRVQYDDLEFIAAALTTQRGLF